MIDGAQIHELQKVVRKVPVPGSCDGFRARSRAFHSSEFERCTRLREGTHRMGCRPARLPESGSRGQSARRAQGSFSRHRSTTSKRWPIPCCAIGLSPLSMPKPKGSRWTTSSRGFSRPCRAGKRSGDVTARMNTQHPTPNIQHPMSWRAIGPAFGNVGAGIPNFDPASTPASDHWMLDVGCSVLDVS